MKIFTLGYQGATLETYIATLLAAGIGIVVDVRETAWSYKPGFSKSPLKAELERAGIEYIHLKSAGNPSANRKTASSQKECLSRYKKHLKSNPSCLDDLDTLIAEAAQRKKKVCLTCFERQPSDCHRSIILSELAGKLAKILPVHLKLPEQPAAVSFRVPKADDGERRGILKDVSEKKSGRVNL